MTSKSYNTRRMAAAGVVLVLVAGGAYIVGRVYPPMGAGTSGTIAPAERYRASQVQNGDIGLGDTSVASLFSAANLNSFLSKEYA